MTPKQEHIFCNIASVGVAVGLEHRYEYLMNYIRWLHQIWPPNELSDKYNEAIDAFLAFEKSTASCPEEEKELAALTTDGLFDKIYSWYNSLRKNKC